MRGDLSAEETGSTGGVTERAALLDDRGAGLPDLRLPGLAPMAGPVPTVAAEPSVRAQGLAPLEETRMAGGPLPASAEARPTQGAADVTLGGQWAGLVARYPWPVTEALSVLWCESRGDPSAYRDGNYGLFQVNTIHAWRAGGDPSALLNPETNVRVAFDVWLDNAGWGPWACKP